MPISPQDKQRLDAMERIVHCFLYEQARDCAALYELVNLAGHYEFMTIYRHELKRNLDRYRSLKQNGKKEETWQRIYGRVYSFQTSISMARQMCERGQLPT